jgi:hypothetical protein
MSDVPRGAEATGAVPAPTQKPAGFVWSVAMAAASAVTALTLALPWQNTQAGGRWAFVFPEGWLGIAACAAGLAVSAWALRWSRPRPERRKMAGFSVLASVLMLAAVGAFAVRTLKAEGGGVGSGPGSVAGSIAVLAWTFLAVKAHKSIGSEGKALRRPAART